MSCCDSITKKDYRNDRFLFGYARDNSAFPLFLLRPVRYQQESFTLISMVSAEALQLDITPEIRILPVDHFYDAFRATPMMSLRPAVIQAFNFAPDMVTHDLRISRQAATALCRPDVRDLVPDEEAEMPDLSPPGSPCKTRDVHDPDGDTVHGSWSSSDDTSADESCTDEEHDQELFLEAYTSFKTPGDFDSASGLQQWFSGVDGIHWMGLSCRLGKLL